MQAAVSSRGLPCVPSSGGRLASYSGLLAAEGSLATALAYLAKLQVQEGELAELKDRLEKALAPTQPVRTQQQQQQQRSQPSQNRQRQTSYNSQPSISRKSSIDQHQYYGGGAPTQPSYFQPPAPAAEQYQPYKQFTPEPPAVPTMAPPAPEAAAPKNHSNPLLGRAR